MKSVTEHGFSDWHLSLDGVSPGVVYPGGIAIDGALLSFSNQLRAAAFSNSGLEQKIADGSDVPDWRVSVSGHTYRVHFERSIDGPWLLFRRVADSVPQINELIPGSIRKLLIHPSLLKGGLVVIAGAAGEGKSTTCAATVSARLARFGGLCWTIEDPAEFPLDGAHGEGRCHQTELMDDHPLADAIKEKKRAFPAKTPGILMLGEVRDGRAIEQALQAALSGLLVIVTLHANDVLSAITRIINAGGSGGSSHWRNIVAQALKIVIHQRFSGTGGNDRKMQFNSIVVDGDTSIVGNFIKEDKVRMINGEIEMQARHSTLGKPLFRDQG